ncbi:MAG: tetraacyldisaccharide 4'-kinase [Paludibacteraceae bacterium]|jgi:tetraacyldisaccharide 4'-kinase|nr:tetraacyldisaccharide 4'-kinase [Paludibacteraceae bacterium]MBR1717010.1 tetraacyldisaccharide 4'-kinase [Paludibacteraceae bacterium]
MKRLLTIPLSGLYAFGVGLRHLLYDEHILPSTTVSVPTICVGNIAVGGTGKTPHVEYLIRLLSPHYKVAVLSRGYKRKTKGFVMADQSATAQSIGDEAMQLYLKYPEVCVAVSENRVKGIRQIQSLRPDVEVVILDDAFQHRALKCGFNIVLTRYDRLYPNDHMLPWGTLRDFKQRILKANAVVVTHCPEEMQPIEKRVVENHLHLPPYIRLYFSKFRYGTVYRTGRPLVVAGIANPQYLMDFVNAHYQGAGFITYADHHAFTPEDLREIESRAKDYDFVLTTEKDFVRLQQTELYNRLAERIEAIAVNMEMDEERAEFDKQVLNYVRENTLLCRSHNS